MGGQEKTEEQPVNRKWSEIRLRFGIGQPPRFQEKLGARLCKSANSVCDLVAAGSPICL